mmetsp:Transcript_17876/g.37513  ORF Transcript_17876/g.37513 Transcript_17876/m.37513 type:complete len:102 (-) Transcript_17876:665-970(-)
MFILKNDRSEQELACPHNTSMQWKMIFQFQLILHNFILRKFSRHKTSPSSAQNQTNQSCRSKELKAISSQAKVMISPPLFGHQRPHVLPRAEPKDIVTYRG